MSDGTEREPRGAAEAVAALAPGSRRGPARARRRVAVVHLAQEWVGGGEAVALASIEALKGDYEVTLVGVTRPDLERMNALFGTRLCWSELGFRLVPRAPALERLFPDPEGLLPHLLQRLRFCRSLARDFDLMLSTFNDMDLGQPGIQYCHHPGMAMAFQPDIVRRVIDRHQPLPSLFWGRCQMHRVLAALSGYRERRVRRNLTLANSSWTASVMEQAYGKPVLVVYPPVSEIPERLPWSARQDGFVCIGRLVRNKRVHDVIRVLERVRALGFPVHLHVVASHADPGYLQELGPLLRANAGWVKLDRSLTRGELLRLLGSQRYGIHAMENEHFGIAVAEMVKAGMIPFVPASGGQVEIVADARLTYASLDDAVAKIARVLGEAPSRDELLARLALQGQRFSHERFAATLRALVARQLEGESPGGRAA